MIRKNQEKKNRHDVESFDNLDALITWSVHIFQYGNGCKYSQKIRKNRIDTIVDNDGVVSTWSVHISKYGN